MLIRECAQTALKELWANRLRSLLSVLGIIIGMIAFIVMTAIMAGIEKQWTQFINEQGGREKISVFQQTPVVDGRSRPELQRPLTLEDAALIKSHPKVRFASPQIKSYLGVSAGGRERIYEEVVGGTRDILRVTKQTLGKGRPFSEADIVETRNVCIIGSYISDKLFGPNADAAGETLEISGQLFTVVGVLKKNVIMQRGRNAIEHKNKVIFIPISVYTSKLPGTNAISQIEFVVRDLKDIGAVSKDIEHRLNQNHRFAGDIKVVTQQEEYLKSKKSFDQMKLSFSLIAGVSLIVGGVGIMNIMIASIAQRVKEIGIRKAVGAKTGDIQLQFLVESVVISVMGGVAGIVLSVGFCLGIGAVMQEMALVVRPEAVLLAVFFSVMVGVVFGIYPALKASRLDPILSLRYQ